MKALFDQVSRKCSEITTQSYSTSFSFGIRFLDKRMHDPIYSIYGFVRFADEIVDTFHGYDKRALLDKFRKDTYEAIAQGISLNPILNAFQEVVHHYNIEEDLYDTFLKSMEMDLGQSEHNKISYDEYILGSAEVVGLMCLRVFTEGNNELYESLKPAAMRLGAAFQKVNFLRDVKADFNELGRSYFPGIDLTRFSTNDKKMIETEIEEDFSVAIEGIKRLPQSSRSGVYLAYIYYYHLFRKIKSAQPEEVMKKRFRVPNAKKLVLMFNTAIKSQLNLL